MDRFIPKSDKRLEDRRTPVKREERRDGDWRRQGRIILSYQLTLDPRPMQTQRTYEEAEPAWMDDNETFGQEDPAIADSSGADPFNYVPAPDLIAAHRDSRHGGGKPLVSFFGAQPPPEPVKVPKTFNAADYLRAPAEDTPELPRQEANAFQSRFQKFFGATSSEPVYQSPQEREPVPAESPENHTSRLIGMLKLTVRVCPHAD